MNNEKEERTLVKDDQLLLSYNEKREPIDIQPRNSFLNSPKAKVVVWGFIFTEGGEILLHRRKNNAKDNRGLWDKSVGGHVERSDLESSKAIARELAEELYTDEQFGNKKKNTSLVANIVKSMRFLGDWDTNKSNLIPDNNTYIYYRANCAFSKKLINSYRILPNAEKVSVRFFADSFFFLAPRSFTTTNLLNSDYFLVSLSDIKVATILGKFPDTNISYTPTPDLSYIINSPLWDDLLDFSCHINKY